MMYFNEIKPSGDPLRSQAQQDFNARTYGGCTTDASYLPTPDYSCGFNSLIHWIKAQEVLTAPGFIIWDAKWQTAIGKYCYQNRSAMQNDKDINNLISQLTL